jgi:hypothetical protein
VRHGHHPPVVVADPEEAASLGPDEEEPGVTEVKILALPSGGHGVCPETATSSLNLTAVEPPSASDPSERPFETDGPARWRTYEDLGTWASCVVGSSRGWVVDHQRTGSAGR